MSQEYFTENGDSFPTVPYEPKSGKASSSKMRQVIQYLINRDRYTLQLLANLNHDAMKLINLSVAKSNQRYIIPLTTFHWDSIPGDYPSAWTFRQNSATIRGLTSVGPIDAIWTDINQHSMTNGYLTSVQIFIKGAPSDTQLPQYKPKLSVYYLQDEQNKVLIGELTDPSTDVQTYINVHPILLTFAAGTRHKIDEKRIIVELANEYGTNSNAGLEFFSCYVVVGPTP